MRGGRDLVPHGDRAEKFLGDLALQRVSRRLVGLDLAAWKLPKSRQGSFPALSAQHLSVLCDDGADDIDLFLHEAPCRWNLVVSSFACIRDGAQQNAGRPRGCFFVSGPEYGCGMRILHTSDWHIGRSFHGNQTLDALRGVLAELVRHVGAHDIDVVIVAGDVFDSSMPAADCYGVLTDALRGIREAGARVIVTSGNHDSAARLGFLAPLLQDGVHVLTDAEAVGTPITLHDEHGAVHFYGIPYLEPALVRRIWPDVALRTQEQVMRHAMGFVNADRASRGGRSVAIAHCFAAGVEPTPQLEREVRQDLRQGSLDVVPLAAFDGPDYVALGHIHGRAELAPTVRYSGAPLHYSFGEAHKPRGSWVIDLGPDGVTSTTWLDLPVPRALTVLRGTLDELLADPAHEEHRGDWVCAVLTDRTAPSEPMRRLRERFPHCATIELQPDRSDEDDEVRTYRERVGRGVPDPQILDDFLEHVRGGDGATEDERSILADVISEVRAQEHA